MARYNAKESEKHWQAAWEARSAFVTANDTSRPKYYVLEMFPYPSGRIHMGHVRNYTMGDVIARFRRAQGFNVLHPMGWDAFGLPAENAAREKGVNPRDWTYDNIKAMKAQLKLMGLSIDWSREFATCDPDYYQHQQRLFIELYKAGLVYRAEADVNWDPVDQTVLANEQVIDGRGWRSGALVERKKLSQWFFKITAYAEDLLKGLETLDRWPEKVRLMQKNWIGRSEGLRFAFDLSNGEKVEVFSTRPDTLFGASFVALSPDHPLTGELAKSDPELAEFVAECRRLGTAEEAIETAEKRGYDTGLKAIHPLDPEWTLPVVVANFVLMGYGTGAIFGCPAHDQRDFDFAKKYDLPILIHPTNWMYYQWVKDYRLQQIFGWPFDTTLAMGRIVFGGVLMRYPNLKLVTHHLGGMLPFYAERARDFVNEAIMDPTMYGANHFPYAEEMKRQGKHPIDYFKQFYADTVVYGSGSALRCGRWAVRRVRAARS